MTAPIPSPDSRPDDAMAADTFGIALESAALGVWDADLVTGRCTYSAQWKRMLGYEPHELADDDPDLWLRLIHPDDRDRAVASGEQHVAGLSERIETEFRLQHRDGRGRAPKSSGRVVSRDGAGRPTRLVGVQTDITRQKQVAHDLALQSERVQLALDAGGIGLWRFEFETGRVFWDARMREIHGIGPGPDEVPRDTWHRRLHPDDAAEAERRNELTITTGAPMRTAYRIVTPAGEVRHVQSLARLVQRDGMPPCLIGNICDVTEQVESALALATEKERLRTTLHSLADAVMATDVDGRLVYANPAALRLVGREDPSGARLDALLPLVDEATGAFLEPAPRVALAAPRTVERLDVALAGPEPRALREVASPVLDAAGAVVGAVLVLQDVTDARRARRDLEYAARHDALTGLLNRSAFETTLAQTLARASPGAPVALAYLDLDRFKVVNDTAGHAAGDALLRLVARGMRRFLPGHATLARIGGDEFAVLYPASGTSEAVDVASRLLAAVENETLVWNERSYRVHASIGVTVVDAPSCSVETASAQADAACLAAKHGGRNRCSVFAQGPGAAERTMREVKLASELTDALGEGRLALHAQEIRDLGREDGGVHVEVLCRMVGRDGAIISPNQFIPAAERFGLMGMLDRWIIENAVRSLAMPGARRDLVASVNLSAQSLGDAETWRFVRDTCAAHGLAPTRLAFEITETAAIGNFDAAADFVRQAREAGCGISLDDFGSGLSSFGYLKRFAIDRIKIDGAFIDGLAGDRFNQAVVTSIRSLARELAVEVVAERIEDAATVEALRSLGVRFGQGYFFDRPRPLGEWLHTAAAVRRRQRTAGVAR